MLPGPWDDRFDTLIRARLPELGAHEPLTAGTDLREAGLDSLGTMELVVDIENAFDVELPDTALTYDTFTTAGSLWRVLQDALGAASDVTTPARGVR